MSEVEKPQLELVLKGKRYAIERILFEVGERVVPIVKGWKLTLFSDPLNHGPYCVIHRPSGRITCDCADYEFVKKSVGGICKHGTALKQIGLLP